MKVQFVTPTNYLLTWITLAHSNHIKKIIWTKTL